MKTGAVILSRYSSNRLPGKALMQINNKPILKYIIERLETVINKDNIIIATSTDNSDNKIEKFAEHIGIKCYRGSLDNVAERFFKAAESESFDYAIRINGDNVFLDTDVLREMIIIQKKGNYNFTTNVYNRTFPKGMSVEIVKLSYFRSLLAKINYLDKYKEHVTLYLYEKPFGSYYYYQNTKLPEASGIQMALDTEEDFFRTKKIISMFELDHTKYNLGEIYNIWKKLDYEEPI